MTRVGFDLGSEGGNAAIDASIVYDQVVPPNGVEDLIACQGASGPVEEEFQQAKFFGGERNWFAILEKFVRCEVQFAGSKLVDGDVRVSPAAKKGAGTCE